VQNVLDEAAAWALVRRALDHSRAGGGAGRVRLGAAAPWVDLDGAGGWKASAPPVEAARALLDLYLPLVLQPDLVIGQLGQSLDGRIATLSGKSHYVTGPADLVRLHRVRALVDAVVVGAGTVALDDPRLTVREAEGENPARVVLDPSGRLPADRRVFTDGAAPTLVLRRADAAGPSPAPSGAEVVVIPFHGPGGFAPAAVLAALRARGLRRVLVEGGGVTVSRFLQAGVLDRLHVTVAPMLMGSGRPGLTLPPIESLDQALRPRCRSVRLGEDVLFDLDLR